MTVTSLGVRNEYTANSGQTVFNYTFLIFGTSDLNVYITPSGQDANDSTDITTAYTIDAGTIGDPNGGFITLDTGATASDLVTIVSNIKNNRATDFQTSGDFTAEAINDSLDKDLSLIKQQLDSTSRTLAFAQSKQNAAALTLPDPSAGLYLVWNVAEDGVENAGAPGSVINSTLNGTTIQMIANASLLAGDIVITTGYSAAGDFGDNTFLARAVTGATADAGSLIKGVGNAAIEFLGLFPKGVYNINQWGASPSNSAAANTVAIQASWDFNPPIMNYPPGVYLINKLTLSDATMSHIGTADQRSAAISSLKFNPSGTATDPMIEMSTKSAGNTNTFSHLNLDTNDRAQYGYYLASVGVFHAIKNMSWYNCWVTNLKSGAVGWQLGDQTNTGFDTDAFNHNWYACHARGSSGAIGWVVDAQNAFNTAWYNCSNGRKDGSNLMLTGIKTIRGSGHRIYNYFGDKLQSSGSPWVIDHNSGSMEIFGMNTEDHRAIKARSIGRDEDGLTVHNLQINDSDGADATVIDSTIITALYDCVLLTLGNSRKVTLTNKCYVSNVRIGSSGVWDITSTERRNILEGHAVGSLTPINHNFIFEQWAETAADKPPIIWALNKGTGTGTITQSTSNNINGRFTVDINCSGANTGDVFGISCTLPVNISAYQGASITLFALVTRAASESVEIECLVDGVNVLTGGTIVLTDGRQVLVFGRIDVPADAAEIDGGSIKVGLASGATGRIFVDTVGVSPYDFTGVVPSLLHHARNLMYDDDVQGAKNNQLRLRGRTLWVDGTGDLRILNGERTADLDGTIVGTQS